MAALQELSKEDVNKLTGVLPSDDVEPELSADLYLYQLIQLEKAVNEAKNDSFGKSLEPMIKDQLKYVQVAVKALSKEDDQSKKLRETYGYDAKGVRKLAAVIANASKAKAATLLVEGMIEDNKVAIEGQFNKGALGA